MTTPSKSARHESLMTKLGADRLRRKAQELHARSNTTLSQPGRHLLREAVGLMEQAVAEFRDAANHKGPGRRHSSLALFEDIPNSALALLTARHILDGVTLRSSLQKTAYAVGRAVEEERQMRWIEKNEPTLWARLNTIYKGAASTRRKTDFVRRVIRDQEFTVPKSDPYAIRKAGLTLVEVFAQSTGVVQIVAEQKPRMGRPAWKQSFVEPTPETIEWLAYAEEAGELLEPFYMPSLERPIPWAGFRGGGYPHGLVHRKSLVKTWDRRHAATLVEAEMPEVYDAVNRIQDTPWRINDVVLQTLRSLWAEGVEIGGLPAHEPVPYPARPSDDLTDEQRSLAMIAWRAAVAQEKDRKARYLRICRMLYVAKQLDTDPFWYPLQLDFRGRVYYVPFYLHPQSDDMARGLIEFADGCTLEDPDAVRWLAIHGANAWGCDKLPLDERVAWVHANRELIASVHTDPVEDLRWGEAEEPWQFLAFCLAWGDYLENGPRSVCRLPVAMDGTNNGLQLYSLALRDPIGAAATNCAPSDRPRDIYQDVADTVTARLKADDSDEARFWLAFTDGRLPRKATKRAVMTLPYGASAFSCQRYVVEWMRETAAEKGITLGTGPEIHRFGSYLATHVWDAIGQTVVAARRAMDWLHEVSDIAAQNQVPLEWTSPLGFPVLQRYLKMRSAIIRTKVGDTTRSTRFKLAEKGEHLDRRKQAQGVAPNFVHSLDAAVLMASVNRAHAQGVRHFSMVHDSYGVLPADAPIMARCLREACVAIFREPVLEQFRSHIQSNLPEGVTLPPVPEGGDFDLEAVLRSPYFFS